MDNLILAVKKALKQFFLTTISVFILALITSFSLTTNDIDVYEFTFRNWHLIFGMFAVVNTVCLWVVDDNKSEKVSFILYGINCLMALGSPIWLIMEVLTCLVVYVINYKLGGKDGE